MAIPTAYPLHEAEALTGGNTNTVLRCGDEVIRPAQPGSTTIQALLAHLRQRGIAWVPAPLGFDAEGRERLVFLPGVVPHDLPDWLWSDTVLHDIARALRQFHDASIGFASAEAIWQQSPRLPAEVICHNDFAPYNLVFQHGQLCGLIDFDCCAPGPRLWDIAYACYRITPLMPHADAGVEDAQEFSPFAWPAQMARLQDFLSAYAGPDHSLRYPLASVLQAIAERLDALAEYSEGAAHLRAMPALAAHARMYRCHASWLRTQTI